MVELFRSDIRPSMPVIATQKSAHDPFCAYGHLYRKNFREPRYVLYEAVYMDRIPSDTRTQSNG